MHSIARQKWTDLLSWQSDCGRLSRPRRPCTVHLTLSKLNPLSIRPSGHWSSMTSLNVTSWGVVSTPETSCWAWHVTADVIQTQTLRLTSSTHVTLCLLVYFAARHHFCWHNLSVCGCVCVCVCVCVRFWCQFWMLIFLLLWRHFLDSAKYTCKKVLSIILKLSLETCSKDPLKRLGQIIIPYWKWSLLTFVCVSVFVLIGIRKYLLPFECVC